MRVTIFGVREADAPSRLLLVGRALLAIGTVTPEICATGATHFAAGHGPRWASLLLFLLLFLGLGAPVPGWHILRDMTRKQSELIRSG